MSIVITDLCKSFGSTPVLQRFTWTVDRPMVLMGRSGCGKTTLLRILLGLESADSGTVTGVETPTAVFQEDRLCPQLTAAANLTLTGHGLTPQDAERELRTLGFTDAELALPAARLSGGQKRRAALLRALLCRDAKTLLLDERFTGMDAELVEDAVAAMVDAISEVRDGEVPRAVRDSSASDGSPIHSGDVMGIIAGSIDVVGSDVKQVTLDCINRMQEEEEGDALTILAGEELSDEAFQEIVDAIEEAQPDLEIDAHRGEQPLYPVIFSIE